AGNLGPRTGHRVDDLARRGGDHLVVIGLEPDADLLSRHVIVLTVVLPAGLATVLRPPRSGVSRGPGTARPHPSLAGIVDGPILQDRATEESRGSVLHAPPGSALHPGDPVGATRQSWQTRPMRANRARDHPDPTPARAPSALPPGPRTHSGRGPNPLRSSSEPAPVGARPGRPGVSRPRR